MQASTLHAFFTYVIKNNNYTLKLSDWSRLIFWLVCCSLPVARTTAWFSDFSDEQVCKVRKAKVVRVCVVPCAVSFAHEVTMGWAHRPPIRATASTHFIISYAINRSFCKPHESQWCLSALNCQLDNYCSTLMTLPDSHSAVLSRFTHNQSSIRRINFDVSLLINFGLTNPHHFKHRRL